MPIVLGLLVALLTPPVFALNGAAIVNGCSGALFTLDGRGEDLPALVITNGHCLRWKDIGGATAFLPAGKTLLDFADPRLAENTFLLLQSETTAIKVTARRLVFATMTVTDVAIYELSATVRELRERHGLSPLLLDRRPFRDGETVEVHSGLYNRTQSCAIDGRTTLREGPYRTENGLRFTADCRLYVGFSGSPILRAGRRVFAGLANTHHDPDAAGPDCGFNKPCEIDGATGEPRPQPHRSYGVPADFLVDCYDDSSGRFDFTRTACRIR